MPLAQKCQGYLNLVRTVRVRVMFEIRIKVRLGCKVRVSQGKS